MMLTAIAHRGPDDKGVWSGDDSGIVLGHRRLAVIDVSEHGHQPMASACGRYVIVLNGEIYNFEKIRSELESTGSAPRWRGHSDTEVALAAVNCWGVSGATERFVGMFAFALWDRAKRILHLVRDRIGEKPLYCGWVGRFFLFGSELKALRAFPRWEAEIDRNALALYLRHNYVPGPYTIYKGIQKLPPGSILSVPSDTGPGTELSPQPYWIMRLVAEGKYDDYDRSDRNETECIQQLDTVLREAIEGQMLSDVPLGAFLSGGIDSSLVVALMQAQCARPVKTFTIGFRQDAYNEAKHASAVAKHLGTDHTELYITPQDALDVIPRLPHLYDEPFSDSSQIPTYLVAKMARQHVTVCLSGDGGDEIFGGYNRYSWGAGIWRRLSKVPRRLRTILGLSLKAVSPGAIDHTFAVLAKIHSGLRIQNPADKVLKLAEVLDAVQPDCLYRGLVSHWKDPSSVVIGGHEPATLLTRSEDWVSLPDFAHRMMYLDAMSYLPDDILVKVDRASMGVSLEVRAPFLDHRVVAFAWGLPLSMKINNGSAKWLSRRVLEQYVPRRLTDRPKMGFGVPIDSWLRGPLREWAASLLDAGRLRADGYFKPEPIVQKWTEHLSGKRNWQYHLWDILMFQAWLESNSGGR